MKCKECNDTGTIVIIVNYEQVCSCQQKLSLSRPDVCVTEPKSVFGVYSVFNARQAKYPKNYPANRKRLNGEALIAFDDTLSESVYWGFSPPLLTSKIIFSSRGGQKGDVHLSIFAVEEGQSAKSQTIVLPITDQKSVLAMSMHSSMANLSSLTIVRVPTSRHDTLVGDWLLHEIKLVA